MEKLIGIILISFLLFSFGCVQQEVDSIEERYDDVDELLENRDELYDSKVKIKAHVKYITNGCTEAYCGFDSFCIPGEERSCNVCGAGLAAYGQEKSVHLKGIDFGENCVLTPVNVCNGEGRIDRSNCDFDEGAYEIEGVLKMNSFGLGYFEVSDYRQIE